MLKKHGGWIELGSADEQKPAKEGTVEAWGRSEKKSCWWMVWIEKGTQRQVWYVCAAIDGATWFGRGDPRSKRK